MSLKMTEVEINNIDSKISSMMDWAKSCKVEAEQLALDSTRLISCTSDRLDILKKQGFFKRCWNWFSGELASIERATVSDLLNMQKFAFRYVNMLQEQNMLMVHSIISIKNNLLSLSIKEEETRNIIKLLAQRTLERFQKIENRIDLLEVSLSLQGWLLVIDERGYDEKYKSKNLRMLRVINEFFHIKNDDWTYTDLLILKKALRLVGVNPDQKITLSDFIDCIIDDILEENNSFPLYEEEVLYHRPKEFDGYSKFVIDNISSPTFISLHGIRNQFIDRLDIIEELQEEMNISKSEALKRIMRRSISNLNVNINYILPVSEIAIEIIACLRLLNNIKINDDMHHSIENNTNTLKKFDINGINNIYENLKSIKSTIEYISNKNSIERATIKSRIHDCKFNYDKKNIKMLSERVVKFRTRIKNDFEKNFNSYTILENVKKLLLFTPVSLKGYSSNDEFLISVKNKLPLLPYLNYTEKELQMLKTIEDIFNQANDFLDKTGFFLRDILDAIEDEIIPTIKNNQSNS